MISFFICIRSVLNFTTDSVILGDIVIALPAPPPSPIYFLIPGDYPSFCPGTISPPGNPGTLRNANSTPCWNTGMLSWQEVGHDLIQTKEVGTRLLVGASRKAVSLLFLCLGWYEDVKPSSTAAILWPLGNLGWGLNQHTEGAGPRGLHGNESDQTTSERAILRTLWLLYSH